MIIASILNVNTLGIAANIAQVVSVITPALVAIIVWRTKNCAYPRCPRVGQHEVSGTAYWACTKHHTADVHELLRKRHPSDRLTHSD